MLEDLTHHMEGQPLERVDFLKFQPLVFQGVSNPKTNMEPKNAGF